MRVTLKDLEDKVSTINKITDSPLESHSVNENGEVKANIGHYCLSATMQGYCLWRESKLGGPYSPLTTKRMQIKELDNALFNYIKGIEEGKKINK